MYFVSPLKVAPLMLARPLKKPQWWGYNVGTNLIIWCMYFTKNTRTKWPVTVKTYTPWNQNYTVHLKNQKNANIYAILNWEFLILILLLIILTGFTNIMDRYTNWIQQHTTSIAFVLSGKNILESLQQAQIHVHGQQASRRCYVQVRCRHREVTIFITVMDNIDFKSKNECVQS